MENGIFRGMNATGPPSLSHHGASTSTATKLDIRHSRKHFLASRAWVLYGILANDSRVGLSEAKSFSAIRVIGVQMGCCIAVTPKGYVVYNLVHKEAGDGVY
jgi:hypothetical protein